MFPAKLLEIHCAEQDRWEGKPLYEAIVAECRSLGIAGATVLRGVEGYGETSAIHHKHLLHKDAPITVLVVDEAEKVQALALAVERMMDAAVMTVCDVVARRVRAS
jgi:PII-like signaling protein